MMTRLRSIWLVLITSLLLAAFVQRIPGLANATNVDTEAISTVTRQGTIGSNLSNEDDSGGQIQGHSGENPLSGAAPSEQDEDDKRNMEESRQKSFLDRLAMVGSMLLSQEEDAKLQQDEETIQDSATDTTTPQSDLRRPGRFIHIVTTASLPWMTGTAVNPLLRAAYLHDRLKEINSGTNRGETTKPVNSWVTLVVPWLELEEDQRKVYNGRVFESKEEQERYVRDWLRDQANMADAAENLRIVFYTARYHEGLGSVFAMGDIIQELPQDELDVCILEEPEHVNWFRAPGQGWTSKYNYVVGIVHTNYDQYATQHYSGLFTAPAIRLMSAAMIKAYCHKVIKLSAVLHAFAPEKEVTENVHGVRNEFIQVDDDYSFDDANGEIYFIGKLLWAKGLNILLDLQEHYKEMTGEYFPVNVYGSGPDQDGIQRAYLVRWPQKLKGAEFQDIAMIRQNLFTRLFTWMNRRRPKRRASAEQLYKEILLVLEELSTKARKSVEGLPKMLSDQVEEIPVKFREAMENLTADLSKATSQLTDIGLPRTLYELRQQPVPATFHGRVDHAALKGSHKIFVNPSVSEVLCTTTAEALAMGKFVIIPVHPSNTFFLRFPNCLGYRNSYEFVANLQWALKHDPTPLSEGWATELTWEAATDRLMDAAAITQQEARDRESLGTAKIDERIAWFHNEMGKGTKGDMIRKVFGGGPVADQVKYVLETQRSKSVKDNNVENESEDDSEASLQKFRDSAFVQAIQQATANSLATAAT